MALPDRLAPLCDLLLGAAFADHKLEDREDDEVRGLLADLSGAELTTEMEARIAAFDPKQFDLAATAAAFADDPEDDRRRVLYLVAAVNDADEEVDFAEDEYLRALCAALKLPASALAGLIIDVEVEALRQDFDKVRRPPPPPPPAAAAAASDGVDVDLD